MPNWPLDGLAQLPQALVMTGIAWCNQINGKVQHLARRDTNRKLDHQAGTHGIAAGPYQVIGWIPGAGAVVQQAPGFGKGCSRRNR